MCMWEDVRFQERVVEDEEIEGESGEYWCVLVCIGV